MAKIFSDFSDVTATRKDADDRMDFALTANPGEENSSFDVGVAVIVAAADALRFEIRAAAQLISAAVGAAIEKQGGQ